MSSVFEHDATPTWSGFIYQGHVAVYLAVNKICELIEQPNNLDKQKIGESYQLEVENWEDVAILREDDEGAHYLSIHQVKNKQEKHISAYQIPLIQLMLENGFMRKNNMGMPAAYLHISNPVEEDEATVNRSIQAWKAQVSGFYDRLSAFADKNVEESGKEDFQKEICEEIAKEPIRFNRSSYKSLLSDTEKEVKSGTSIDDIKQSITNFLDCLEEKIAIKEICDCVKVYKYADKIMHCSPEDIYTKIVDQVRRYKKLTQPGEHLINEQYEYIADKLLSYMRGHILRRHQLMQRGESYSKVFAFREIIRILDESLDDYEQKANIEALRRMYDRALSQYCQIICKQECEDQDSCKCRLLNEQYSKAGLGDDDFVKMCFTYNPDCAVMLTDRSCLSALLRKDGLMESVFEVLRCIPDRYFMRDDDRTRVVLNDGQKNALLTAISVANESIVIDDIVQGINKNAALVSSIFDADELITGRLSSDDASIWDRDYSEISEKYMETVTDDAKNSICRPKKPIFVKAEEIIKRLN